MEAIAPRRDIVVIGASAGGIPVLRELAARLPARFPASLLVVQHIGAHKSILPELLAEAGALPAEHPVSGAPLEKGKFYVAPPDQHMLVVDGRIRLHKGAKENHARPAIDPLFRSAAIAKGSRVIGVVLSGRLDDGTAGLQAIKACGGLAVVQSPEDAEQPEMPTSARDNVAVDLLVTQQTLADSLIRLVQLPAPAVAAPPDALAREHRIATTEEDPMEDLDEIGMPAKIVCPDCNGVLWEIRGSRPLRYRCHTGHAYTQRSLEHSQALRADAAVWNALRALQEREYLLREFAGIHRRLGDHEEAERLEAEARHAQTHASQLQGIATRD